MNRTDYRDIKPFPWIITSFCSFLQLGGFDLSYGRGYFEDTDIAFKLRKHGHQVVIQPMSLAYHQEGSTLGNEESEARKVLFENGMRIFQGKWGQEIQVNSVMDCP